MDQWLQSWVWFSAAVRSWKGEVRTSGGARGVRPVAAVSPAVSAACGSFAARGVLAASVACVASIVSVVAPDAVAGAGGERVPGERVP